MFDCADIYSRVETLLGSFIEAHGLGPDDISIHTKYVPDLASLGTLERRDTERVIDRSRSRLGLDRLDLSSSTGGITTCPATWLRWKRSWT